MTIDDNLLKELGAVDTVVYTLIADNPHITQKELARSCKLSTRTVINVLQRLEDKHYIRIKNNKPNPNTYGILYHPNTPSSSKAKKAFGEFGHVLLSEHEYQKLIEDFNGDTALVNEYIKKLDDYMEIHPEKQYAAHQRVLHNWITDDRTNQRKKLKPPKGAKYWYDGKTYGELIRSLSDAQKRIEYLSILTDIQQHEVATMPLDDYVNAVKEQREYETYAFQMKFLEGEE